MSNIRAIRHVDRIINVNQGGGTKKQGIASSTNLNTTAHVAFRNRNVVCACNRHVVFCMNQLGGVGAGGIPGRSYMFASTADGVSKNKILCGVNHKNIRHPSKFELIYSQDTLEKKNNPVVLGIYNSDEVVYLDYIQNLYAFNNNDSHFDSITKCYYTDNMGTDFNCYSKLVGDIYILKIHDDNTNMTYTISFVIIRYEYNDGYLGYIIRFINKPNFFTKEYYGPSDYGSGNPPLKVLEIYKSTYKVKP